VAPVSRKSASGIEPSFHGRARVVVAEDASVVSSRPSSASRAASGSIAVGAANRSVPFGWAPSPRKSWSSRSSAAARASLRSDVDGDPFEGCQAELAV